MICLLVIIPSMLFTAMFLLQERAQLDAAHAAALEAATAQAAARHDSLRSTLESQIAAISSRLVRLAAQETKRDKRRQELMQQVRGGGGQVVKQTLQHAFFDILRLRTRGLIVVSSLMQLSAQLQRCPTPLLMFCLLAFPSILASCFPEAYPALSWSKQV